VRTIKYIGGHDEVYVPLLGAAVERGGELEVDDPAIAASLLEQDDVWAPVEHPAPARASRSTAPAPAPADAKEA
jgi:hypothetical protein